MRASAARAAGCVLDLIAELTLEGSFGDAQIVVSVKETYRTVDELADDVGASQSTCGADSPVRSVAFGM